MTATPRYEVIAIAASTGGPDALAHILPQLPASINAPILVVQHIKPTFMAWFAARLDRLSKLTVRVASPGVIARPGEVWLAPGDRHMIARRGPTGLILGLSSAPPVHGCRPAADPLFLSLAKAAPGRVLAVVLTGMGEDGAEGAVALRGAGHAQVMVQDKPSSVVWGMPGAVVKCGAANQIVPLDGIARRIVTMTLTGPPRRPVLPVG